MVQIQQNEEEIKIVIELNRLITRKPDVVLLPTYIKFNNPPIFFERHLMDEIDETSSFCRIFKSEARIVLIKKNKGMWPELFKTFEKDDLLQKRLDVADEIVQRNKERDEKAVARYEQRKRSEIDKEIKRESEMRERLKQFEHKAITENIQGEPQQKNNRSTNRLDERAVYPPSIRSRGVINFNFSDYNIQTPKRESQAAGKGVHKDI